MPERREATIAQLRRGALNGSLTLDDFAAGLEIAYSAETVEELDALGVAPAARRPRWRALLGFLRPRRPRRQRVEISVSLPRDASRVTVGRSDECDVVVGESTVAPVHAELTVGGGGRWTVRDLGSATGTWLNGRRVREAPVCRGDVLWLGGLRMELQL